MSRLSSIIAALQDRIVKGATKTELPPGTLIDCQPPFDINHGERISLDELRWKVENSDIIFVDVNQDNRELKKTLTWGCNISFFDVVTIAKIIDLMEERLNDGASKVVYGIAKLIITEAIEIARKTENKYSLNELNTLNDSITSETTFIANVDKDGEVYDISLIGTNHLDEKVKTLLDKNDGLLVVVA